MIFRGSQGRRSEPWQAPQALRLRTAWRANGKERLLDLACCSTAIALQPASIRTGTEVFVVADRSVPVRRGECRRRQHHFFARRSFSSATVRSNWKCPAAASWASMPFSTGRRLFCITISLKKAACSISCRGAADGVERGHAAIAEPGSAFGAVRGCCYGPRHLDLCPLAHYIAATCGRPVNHGYPARLLKSPEQSSRSRLILRERAGRQRPVRIP